MKGKVLQDNRFLWVQDFTGFVGSRSMPVSESDRSDTAISLGMSSMGTDGSMDGRSDV